LSEVPLYEPKVEWVAMLPRAHYHIITVLARASAHGRSQLKLKHQNLGVGGYTEKVLKWFNYP